MHATTANRVTCCAPSCSQPGTRQVVRCREPERVRLAVDGTEYLIEHDPIVLDYCDRCAGRL